MSWSLATAQTAASTVPAADAAKKSDTPVDAPASTAATGASDVIGDRLIVTINNVPYSQRQVEIYIHVKESLRRTNDGTTRTIVAQNWNDAVTVFTEDMIVLQESQRLGSFQAPEQAFDKYLAVVREKIAKGQALAAALARLGGGDHAVARALEEVLRVAAFRRSKDRQDAPASSPNAAPASSPNAAPASSPNAAPASSSNANATPAAAEQEAPAAGRDRAKWLQELVERANVRRYADAAVYKTIEPMRGSAGDGSP